MAFTQEQVAQMLGVTRPRVSQLKSSGELTELTEAGVEAYLKKKKSRDEERDQYKQRRDDAERERHEQILTQMKSIDRSLMLIAAALGAKVATDAMR